MEDSAFLSKDRYRHLLQPIKDLAKNWDVDIAAILDEYVTQLEEAPAMSRVNFAEAAMLIQVRSMPPFRLLFTCSFSK